jgi:hypothetical protein
MQRFNRMRLSGPPPGFSWSYDRDNYIELVDAAGDRVAWAMPEPSGRWLCIRVVDSAERTARSRLAAAVALVGLVTPGHGGW